MLAVPTANVWEKTQLMLHSLAAITDPFELVVVDELSSDGTVEALKAANVTVLQTRNAYGVTFNWNLAYTRWKAGNSPYLFISNNDVLIPNGALTALANAMTPEGGDCDVIAPLSTVLGKGWWGRYEGAEVLFGLSPRASAFIQQPLNYQIVQDVLSKCGCQGMAAVRQNRSLHKKPGFSGFFFGVRRSSIDRFQFNATHLFDPAKRNLGQETDLTSRLDARKGKICLHTGTWVFHYKGSTIPTELGSDREHFNVMQHSPARKRNDSRLRARADHEPPLTAEMAI